MEQIVKQDAVQVLVVDDSALMRNLVSRIVDGVADLTVVGTAMNGKFALAKIETIRPDIIVLDLEMPEMNGIAFLKERKARGIDIPVIILSSIAQKGASITMEALSLGAVDFIMKPSGSVSEDIHVVGNQLVELLRYYGWNYRRGHGGGSRPSVRDSRDEPLASPASTAIQPASTTTQSSSIAPPHPRSRSSSLTGTPLSIGTLGASQEQQVRLEKPVPMGKPGPLEIIVIGISTGGPNALRKVFAELNGAIKVPILVVQHMPAGFTSEFAKSLDRICPLEVKEAAEGDIVKPGRILIAPGDSHIIVEKRALATVLHLDDRPPVNGHRPSADVLFESVGTIFGNRAMGIIMTGMGRDGAEKLGLIYKAGGITLGQDEPSSVVYGMPRVAFDLGHVGRQVSLDGMAAAINETCAQLAP